MSNIQFKDNWDETRQRMAAWFAHEKTGRPVMTIPAWREESEKIFPSYEEQPFDDFTDQHTNPDKNFARLMNFYGALKPMAEAFPQFSMNLGAGSMALYLGSRPEFAQDTIWFEHVIENYDAALPLRFDPENIWFKKHIEITKRQMELCKDTDIMVCIPDIVENIDILSAMRDPQTLCYDLFDYPEQVAAALDQIQSLYMAYYDTFYNLVRRDGLTAYTAFNIFGEGKAAKIQCDCGALLSPGQFDELILPSLAYQCDALDQTLFHLDGPECLVHVDSLMTLDKLDALQWTPGSGNEKCGDERWFGLYEKVKAAGKGLWLPLYDYTSEEAVACADDLIKRFGAHGMYLHFPYMTQKEGEALLIKAERDWKD